MYKKNLRKIVLPIFDGVDFKLEVKFEASTEKNLKSGDIFVYYYIIIESRHYFFFL